MKPATCYKQSCSDSDPTNRPNRPVSKAFRHPWLTGAWLLLRLQQFDGRISVVAKRSAPPKQRWIHAVSTHEWIWLIHCLGHHSSPQPESENVRNDVRLLALAIGFVWVNVHSLSTCIFMIEKLSEMVRISSNPQMLILKLPTIWGIPTHAD